MSQMRCPKCYGDGEVDCPKSDCFGGIVNPLFGDPHCKYCHGKGKVRCNKCGGTGTVDKKAKKTNRSKSYNYRYSNDSTSDYSSSSSSDYQSSYTNIFGLFGLSISIFSGFYKGCGLFHFDPQMGNAYLFDIDDAVKGFLIFPIIGILLGLILDIWGIIRKK